MSPILSEEYGIHFLACGSLGEKVESALLLGLGSLKSAVLSYSSGK